MNKLDRTLIEALASFDTPTICNVVELFDIRPCNAGFMDSRITAAFPELPPAVGCAATATFRSDAPPPAESVYGSVAEQIERFAELSGPAFVVFQDLDDPPRSATFGEMMCTAYQKFGAVGLITGGAGRDLDQVRAIGFPVFTGGTIVAHGYCHVVDIHVPVRVGGLPVHPDDVLHADRNGVTSIPREIVTEVPGVAREYVAAEASLLDYLNAGDPTPDGYREALSELRRRIDELRRRIAAKTAVPATLNIARNRRNKQND